MGAVIDLREVLEVEVGVDLGGADVGVAEQFLYRAQITAGFQQMAGEGVSQGVRVDIPGNALAASPVFDALLYGTCAQPFPAAAGKNGRLRALQLSGAYLHPGT